MTKLTQWMFCIVLFLSCWLAVIGGYSPVKVSDEFLIWVYLVSFSRMIFKKIKNLIIYLKF